MKSKTAEKDLQLFLFQEGDILERPSNQQLQVLLYISALNRVLRQDPIFDGLISKHSGLNFHNDRQHREALSWDILGDEEKLRIENRYAYEALRHLVNSVLTTDLPFNEDVYLTSCEVDFGTRYFGGLEAKVASFGKLYCVVLLASFLKQFFGCAFDYAVLMVITGNLFNMGYQMTPLASKRSLRLCHGGRCGWSYLNSWHPLSERSVKDSERATLENVRH